MSMNNANYLRSPCEVIREINDLFQGDSVQDKLIRELCAEAENMTKRIAIELSIYDKEYHKGWWDGVSDYAERMEHRKDSKYKFVKI